MDIIKFSIQYYYVFDVTNKPVFGICFFIAKVRVINKDVVDLGS